LIPAGLLKGDEVLGVQAFLSEGQEEGGVVFEGLHKGLGGVQRKGEVVGGVLGVFVAVWDDVVWDVVVVVVRDGELVGFAVTAVLL
jgi:hypothetical protein